MLNNQDEIWDEYIEDDGADDSPWHSDAPQPPW